MRQFFDQFAKQVLTRVLNDVGEVRSEYEVSTDAQKVDVWFTPKLGVGPAREELGILGRMASEPSMFEPFRKTPETWRVLECVRKQLTLWHVLGLKDDCWRQMNPPRLWILSPGVPREAIEGFQLEQMLGWPEGFYGSVNMCNYSVVILKQLPRERATLLLRLLGAGLVFKEAVEDLMQLPQDAPEKWGVSPILARMRIQLMLDTSSRSDDEEEFLMNVSEELVEEYLEKIRTSGVEQGREQGIEQGREQGLQSGLCATFRARFGRIPHEAEEAIRATMDIERLEKWFTLFVTVSEDEILKTLQSAKPPH